MQKELKYAISYIGIYPYENIKNLGIKDIPTTAKWIFVTGEHSKDTFLKAIALGLNDGAWLLGSDLLSITVKCKECGEMTYHENTQLPDSKYRKPSLDYNIAAYGTHRFLDFPAPYGTSNIANLFNRRTMVCFDKYLSSLLRWYNFIKERRINDSSSLELEENLATVVNIMSSISEITDAYLDESNLTEAIYVFNGGGYKYKDLPINVRYVLSFIFDILIALNNGFVPEDFNKIKIAEPNTLHGIVIIDSIEANLSPKQQHKLVELLDEIFPNVQFIVSTNSPIPILAAPKNAAFIKLENDKETGIISAKLLDIDVSVLMPNALLTSPLFDFQDIISNAYNEKYALETNCDYFEIVKIQQRRARLGLTERDF